MSIVLNDIRYVPRYGLYDSFLTHEGAIVVYSYSGHLVSCPRSPVLGFLGIIIDDILAVREVSEFGLIVCLRRSTPSVSFIRARRNFHLCGHFETYSLFEFKLFGPSNLAIHFFSQVHRLQCFCPFLNALLDSTLSHCIWKAVFDFCNFQI